MTITATMVRDLREKTGAGMMDCKKALAETSGDMEAAVDWLRKKGMATAAKKAGRAAAEGLVGVYTIGHKGAIVEVNAETDFVARNEQFQKFVTNTVKKAVLHSGDVDSFKSTPYSDERSVEEELSNLISVIGENMILRRLSLIDVNPGVVGGYIHAPIAEGLGRIGVLVALESSGDKTLLEPLAKQLAMHVAATRPLAIHVDELDQATVEREKAIVEEQARASGKPQDVIDKMVAGRLRKFYEEVVLTEQTFVIDGETRIKDVLKNAEKTCGGPVKIVAFDRLELGEGVEKKVDDFAAEVASLSQ